MDLIGLIIFISFVSIFIGGACLFGQFLAEDHMKDKSNKRG